MEFLQHLIGACPDHQSHLDLTDLAYAGGAGAGIYSVRYYIKGSYLIIKEEMNKLFGKSK